MKWPTIVNHTIIYHYEMRNNFPRARFLKDESESG